MVKRNEKDIIVKPIVPGHTLPTPRSTLDPQLEATVLQKLRTYIMADRVNVANLRAYLRLRKQNLSGNKKELAERAAALEDPPPDSFEAPLALNILEEMDEDAINAE